MYGDLGACYDDLLQGLHRYEFLGISYNGYRRMRKNNSGFRLSSVQVLISDKLTVKIMAYACKMAEITDAGIYCKLPKPGSVII